MSIIKVADVKEHANITLDDDDVLIAAKIAAAETWIGAFIGTPLTDFDPLPDPLREAVLQLTAHLYEHREATFVAGSGLAMTDVSPGLFDLVAPYRSYVF